MKQCAACRSVFDADVWRCPSCSFTPPLAGRWPTFAADLVQSGPKEFDDSIYARMKACENRSFYLRSRRRLIEWAFTTFFPSARNFYDFGAGTGFVLEGLHELRPDLKLFASDLAISALSWIDARLAGRITLFHADAARVPYVDHFDVVGAFDVIEHIDDDVAVLKSLHRLVKPGGGILVTVPQHRVLWSQFDDKTGHKRRYCGNELAVKVRQAGFSVILDTCFMGTLFLPQYLSRRLWVGQDGEKKFESEHMLPGPVNGLLRAVLEFELFAHPFGLAPAARRHAVGGRPESGSGCARLNGRLGWRNACLSEIDEGSSRPPPFPGEAHCRRLFPSRFHRGS